MSALVSKREADTRSPRYRFCWDDENADYGFRSRTLSEDLKAKSPPAVIRYYRGQDDDKPPKDEKAGDFRVNLETPVNWRPFVIALNGEDERKFSYWIGKARAQFNSTGWPRFAYVGMCGNEIKVIEKIGEWYKFETLKQTDIDRAQGMTILTHPHFIHRFTCVTWKNNQTVRIHSTNTPRGDVHYPLVTKEGYAFIPARHVVQI